MTILEASQLPGATFFWISLTIMNPILQLYYDLQRNLAIAPSKRLHRTVYHFDTFASAGRIAKDAYYLGCEECQITRTNNFFALELHTCLEIDIRILNLGLSGEPIFRNGSIISIQERNHIVDCFAYWYSVEEISAALCRHADEIIMVLIDEGWLEEPQKGRFGSEDVAPVEVSNGCLDSWDIEFLNGFDLIEARSQPPSLIEFRDLTRGERDGLYEYFRQFRPDSAYELAMKLDERIRAFNFAREFEWPVRAFWAIQDVPGLPSKHLHQREVLKTYVRDDLAQDFAARIGEWVQGAMLREADYRATQISAGSPPKFSIPHAWREGRGARASALESHKG